jgi:hypothetical protein
MSQKSLPERVSEVKAVLEALEADLGEGSVPREGLEDFKMAVDHIRLSIWSILTASQSEDYKHIIARFRLSRAAEMCRHIVNDINDGIISGDLPELQSFYTAVHEALSHVRQERGG